VGDEQVRQAAGGAQVQHQAQQLGPDRHVEHRHRLVGHDDLGLEHERAGDHDPLPLATRELVREASGEVRRRPQAGRVERVEDAPLALRRRADPVHEQRLHDELTDRVLRVQRLVWVLEDELHPPPVFAQGACPPQRRHVATVEQDPPRGLARQLDDDPTGRRLAAARLPDQREDLPAVEGQIDAVDGTDDAARPPRQRVREPTTDREVHTQVLEAQHLFPRRGLNVALRRGHPSRTSIGSSRRGVPPSVSVAPIASAVGTVTGTPSLPAG
jgi:hypothetical protein